MAAYDFEGKSSRKKGQNYLPPAGSEKSLFRKFFDVACDPDSSYRVEDVREIQMARAYYLNHQWLDPLTADRDRTRTVRFTDPNPNAKIARPVMNECTPIIDNETSKLYKRRSTAYVRPIALQAGTGGEMGSAVANDILEWHLDMVRWPRLRRRAIWRMVMYGTAFYWSYLDQDYLDSVQIGVTEARRCTGACGSVLASPELPAKELLASEFPLDSSRIITQTSFNTALGEPERAYTAKACPSCGSGIESFVPDDSQMLGQDLFGRPLSQDVPKNQPALEIPPPWEIYIENEGIGIDDPKDVKEWYRATPRSLDWVEAHHPHLMDKITPDDPATIANYFPITGEYSYGSQGSMSMTGRNVWRNHVIVFTAVCKASKKNPDGRLVEAVSTKFEIGRDEPLYRKSKRDPQVKIPLVTVTASRFFPKDGELRGQGLMRGLFSDQNRINMIASQTTDYRQRNGVGGVMATDGMRLISGWLEGYPGRYIRWTPDPRFPNKDPQFIETRTIDQGVEQERQGVREHMQQYAGSQDVDLGKAPRNVSAATAIQLLQEMASGRREGREEELIDAFREVYSHQLLLLAEFAIEPRQYRAKAQNGKWEYKQFMGQDLAGHTDVMVEEQAGYDARAFEREALTAAINLGIVIISTPYARREAAQAYGVSMKINDEENVQMSDAEAKWYGFRDKQAIPIPDYDLDDHFLMYSVYGRFLKSSEGVDLAVAAGWPEMLPLIGGWEEKRKQALALEAQFQALVQQASAPDPPPQTDPMTGMVIPQPSPSMIAQTALAGMATQGMTAETVKMPKDTMSQVLFVWQKLGVDVQVPYVQFRAAFATHKIDGEAKKTAAMIGPTFAAPGGAQTQAGLEPVTGSTAMPGPGSQAGGIPAEETAAMQA